MVDFFEPATPAGTEPAVESFLGDGLCCMLPPAPAPKPGPPPNGALDIANYLQCFNPRKKDARKGAQSTYEGCVVVTSLPRQLVAAILPAQLALAPSNGPALATHPVIYVLGVQTHPCGLEKGQPTNIPFAQPYTELILLVPFSVGVGGDKWHNYAARMYLDSIPAIGIGDSIYAYAKEIGEFETFGASTLVRQFGRTLFESELSDFGPWMTDAIASQPGALPGYAEAKQVFEMPIMGVSQLLGMVPSYFEWNCTAAQVRAVRSEHRFVREFCPGMQDWVGLGRLGSDANAAFEVRDVTWRLSTELPTLDL